MQKNLGTDILFDADGDLTVTPSGDLGTGSGATCLLQDIRDRLGTMPGDLYAHLDWGCQIGKLLGAPDTALNRALAVRYIRHALENESRIKKETISIKTTSFTPEEKIFEIHFTPIGGTDEQSLVWGFGLNELPIATT